MRLGRNTVTPPPHMTVERRVWTLTFAFLLLELSALCGIGASLSGLPWCTAVLLACTFCFGTASIIVAVSAVFDDVPPR